MNPRLINYCTHEGIDLQHSFVYTPQENGIAKRKSRTLKEMTTCMLQHKYLNQIFWAEATCCANYIQNNSPHKALDIIKPFEALCRRKPSVKHFRVFGCLAWARIPPQKRKTLEPQSKPCTFVGYADHLKAYKLMDPQTHEIFFERSVHFEETYPSLAPSTPPSSFMESDNSDLEDDIPSTLTRRTPTS